jgi:hypothetical protein
MPHLQTGGSDMTWQVIFFLILTGPEGSPQTLAEFGATHPQIANTVKILNGVCQAAADSINTPPLMEHGYIATCVRSKVPAK